MRIAVPCLSIKLHVTSLVECALGNSLRILFRAAAATTQTPSSISKADAEFENFCQAARGANVVPMYRRIFSDQLTPVLAYRCLVKENDVNAPSFLLESVVNGDQTGRYSFLGAMPALEVVAKGNKVTVLDHLHGSRTVTNEPDPMEVSHACSRSFNVSSMFAICDAQGYKQQP